MIEMLCVQGTSVQRVGETLKASCRNCCKSEETDVLATATYIPRAHRKLGSQSSYFVRGRSPQSQDAERGLHQGSSAVQSEHRRGVRSHHIAHERRGFTL